MNTSLEAIRPDGLIEARHELTAKENDIIDLVLNTIKDDNEYVYEIDIEKYKGIYNLGSANIYRDLKKATNDLYEKHNNFSIKNKATGEEMKFVWFSMLTYIDKKGKIYFEIGHTLKNMLLNMKKKIYYRIEYPINFKSLYSKRIYYMLKSFEDTGWRIDKIDDLKHKLYCPLTYKNFATFRKKVLDMASEEINNASDIKFTYEQIKTGRKVTAIKFHIVSNKAKNVLSVTSDKTEDTELIKQVQAICHRHSITESEAKCMLKDAKNSIDTIRECYSYILTKENVPNVVGYMRTLLKGFNKPQSQSTKDGGFNDYEQRVYDFAKLEKKLNGWEENEEKSKNFMDEVLAYRK
ncbi:RepB family plasmid replication initiator protein [Clostridium algoriphilum]|uniref:replication initiation protein n=1 Tax=Clostridium algoriphilum TaxID=198347 RepID=UPI001CF58981|nr:RepB family plasmid replication initiator protein [Clostridium algoriphilum]MCB2296082.1 RepB family plasmid replication initiator protein [Clostridium algoriphilum]